MTNSRNKGASFERQIAQALDLLTGIRFARNLEQVRAIDHCDLVPDNAAWPFSCELKRYASGHACRPEWKAQATRAAEKTGRFPVVIFKFDRLDIRCAVPMRAIAHAFGGRSDCDEWTETTLDGLAYLAREIMARNAECS